MQRFLISSIRHIQKNFLFVILFTILMIPVYIILYKQAYVEFFSTDFLSHLNRIEPIVHGEYYMPHSLFHYLVYFIHLFLSFIIAKAPKIEIMLWLQVLFFAITLLILHYELRKRAYNKIKTNLLLIVSFSLMVCTSVFIPGLSKFFYLGTWGPNIWHSPTMYLLKPLALFVFFGFVRYISSVECSQNLSFFQKNTITVSVFLLLSVWAKPSLAITFLPAVFVFCFIYYYTNFKALIQVAFICFPAVLLLGFQYYYTYYNIAPNAEMNDNIKFTMFGLIRNFHDNVFFCLITAIAFPLSIIIVDYRNAIRNKGLILAWLMVFFGYLQVAFLIEEKKFNQGAFAFGFIISLFILFVMSALHIIESIIEKNCSKKISIIIFIFILHFVSGIVYYLNYLNTGLYD